MTDQDQRTEGSIVLERGDDTGRIRGYFAIISFCKEPVTPRTVIPKSRHSVKNNALDMIANDMIANDSQENSTIGFHIHPQKFHHALLLVNQRYKPFMRTKILLIKDDSSFFIELSPLVMDGTRCTNDPEKFDLCIRGGCEEVGCDRSLNGNKEFDHCRKSLES